MIGWFAARAVAYAFVGSALLVLGCGTMPVRTPAPQAAATPTPQPAGEPAATGNPADATSVVRDRVPAGQPRLLPGSVPPGMSASASIATGGSYSVSYTDDLHTREIVITDAYGVNPPLPGSRQVSASRQFRGVRASYDISDGAAPKSERSLMWDEPGNWPRGQDGLPSNQFYLRSSGLTEAEFFQVADSLRPVS